MRTLKLALCAALLVAATACGGAPSSLFHSAGYYVRGDKVYYLNAFPGKAFVIDGADAKRFTTIDETYAKDDHAVYLDGVPLTGADPASFALIPDAPDYAKDSGHVFLRDRVLTTDVAHFSFFEGGGMSKDGSHVYWSDGRVVSDDPEHFKIVSTAGDYFFTTDSTTVEVNSNPIKGADPATFTVLRGGYSKDADDYFYFDERMHGVDAGSFETLADPYARDDAHAYWMAKVIPGADPGTFRVLNKNFQCTADAQHAYYEDQLIQDFDPATIPAGATVTNCSATFLGYS